MRDLETRVRDGLRARADDVEPTPELFREVTRRIERRARWRVAVYALAGVTAVLLGALVVPTLVREPRPSIEPLPAPSETATETVPPTVGAFPELLVGTDGRRLVTIDPETGQPVAELFELSSPDLLLGGVAVRPGSTADDLTIVYTVKDRAADTWSVEGLRYRDGAVAPSFGPWEATFNVPADAIAPPRAVWSPTGDALAYTFSGTEGGDPVATIVYVQPWSDRGPEGDRVPLRFEDQLARSGGSMVLEDWVGSTDGGTIVATFAETAFDDGSELRGQVLFLSGVAPIGSTYEADADLVDARFVVAYASSHLIPGSLEAADYLLVFDEGSPGAGAPFVLQRSGDGDQVDELLLPPAMGAASPYGAWLTAWGDAAVVGDGAGGAWVVSVGAEPVPLEGTWMWVAPVPGDVQPGVEPTDAPTTSPPATTTTEVSALAAQLDAPIAVSTGNVLSIVRPEGQRLALAELGVDTTVEAVALRPGSTVDDLTVVWSQRTGDTQELRYAVLRRGVIESEGVFDGPYAPTPGHARGLIWPVWEPEGRFVAWAETGTSGTAAVRVVGWGDDRPGTGDTATDNAAFELQGEPDSSSQSIWGPLVASSWAPPGEDQGIIWLGRPAGVKGEARGIRKAYGLLVEIQGDGAVASTGTFDAGQDVEAVVGPFPSPSAWVARIASNRVIVEDPLGSAGGASWPLPGTLAVAHPTVTTQLDVIEAPQAAGFLVTGDGQGWWLEGPESASRLTVDGESRILSIDLP